MEKMIEKRLKGGRIGFDRNKGNNITKHKIMQHLEPEDLVSYGFIPELVGRLPIYNTLKVLSAEALRKILTQPKNSIIKQYKKLFEMEGVILNFTDDALDTIVRAAVKRKTGARALRSILEKSMQDIMYEIPSLKNISECTITKEVIAKKAKPKFSKLRKTAWSAVIVTPCNWNGY